MKLRIVCTLASLLFLCGLAQAQPGPPTKLDESNDPCRRFKLRIIEPAAGVDYKLRVRTPEAGVDYKLKVINPCVQDEPRLAQAPPVRVQPLPELRGQFFPTPEFKVQPEQKRSGGEELRHTRRPSTLEMMRRKP